MAWIKRIVAKCNICGHEWIPTVEEPRWCAKCKARGWNKG